MLIGSIEQQLMDEICCFKAVKSVVVKSYATDEDVRELHSEFLMKAKKSLLLKIAIPLLMRQTYLSSAYLSYYL